MTSINARPLQLHIMPSLESKAITAVVEANPRSTMAFNAQPAQHSNTVPRQLVQQQLLREAIYPHNVRQVIEQVLSGKNRGNDKQADVITGAVQNFDLNRKAGRQVLPLAVMRRLHSAAEDGKHPLQHDAKLLLAIALRDSDTPLNSFLAAYLKKDFELEGDIPAQPDSRTYNSHLPSIALRAQDYGSVGRVLMTQGAARLFDNDAQTNRKQRLSSVMWSLDKCPQLDKARKTFQDFCIDDPLDNMNVYEF